MGIIHNPDESLWKNRYEQLRKEQLCRLPSELEKSSTLWGWLKGYFTEMVELFFK